MKLNRIVFALVLTFSAGAMQAQKISVDYDHSASFQGYKTYAWAKGTPLNQLWDARVIEAVDKQLAAKGFQKVDAGASPDLFVLYHAALGQEQQLNTFDSG